MTEVHDLSEPTPRRLAVWNILLDARYPQAERLESLTETLQATGEFDMVGILEAQYQNGQYLARQLSGTEGVWYEHSRKKRGERIGVFGPDIHDIEPVELGYSKVAVVARLGEVAVATVHLRRQPTRFPPTPEQVEQITALLDYLSSEEKAIIMGDFNSLWFQKTRRSIKAVGYESAFHQIGKRRKGTLQANDNFSEMYSRRERLMLALAGGAINLDDIYTKGVNVTGADYFDGVSDHKGVWVEYEED